MMRVFPVPEEMQGQGHSWNCRSQAMDQRHRHGLGAIRNAGPQVHSDLLDHYPHLLKTPETCAHCSLRRIPTKDAKSLCVSRVWTQTSTLSLPVDRLLLPLVHRGKHQAAPCTGPYSPA